PDGTNEVHVIRRRVLGPLDAKGRPVRLAAIDPAMADKDSTPLAAAINEFNAHYHTLAGQPQPPLTEEEVVAAIRRWKSRRDQAPVSNSEFENFQRIAETRHLPKDVEFEVLGHFQPNEQLDFHIWSVRIVMPRTSGGGTY